MNDYERLMLRLMTFIAGTAALVAVRYATDEDNLKILTGKYAELAYAVGDAITSDKPAKTPDGPGHYSKPATGVR